MTDQERKAMEVALGALEYHFDDTADSQYAHVGYAKNALRQALAQPEQEPVAIGCYEIANHNNEFELVYPEAIHKYKWFTESDIVRIFYTAPPSKPWVDLSVDEIYQAADREERVSDGFVQGALWAEAALWEKNSG